MDRNWLGFLNLNKPAGFTSHDCIGRVRRLLGLKRVGHGGTLDPMATGVLPIGLGAATRLLQFLPEQKAYRATLRLGLSTTTDDITGTPLSLQPYPVVDVQQIEPALQQFLGKIEQIPPQYSAIQVQGQRLYDLARQGKNLDLAARSVEIFQIQILDWRDGEFPELDLDISCGPGTYIRAIARDLGQVLGTGGTLAALTRTRSGGFELTDSLSLTELESQLQQQHFCPISPSQALNHLATLMLEDDLARRWSMGQKISLADIPAVPVVDPRVQESIVCVQTATTCLGIGSISHGLLNPKVVLSAV